MKKSKIIALLTACAMAIGTFGVPAVAAAEDEVAISATTPKTTLSRGEEFNVTIDLTQNPVGLSYLGLLINYDENALELTKVVAEKFIDATAQEFASSSSLYKIQWWNGGYKGEVLTPKLATLTFKAIGIGDAKIAATIDDNHGTLDPIGEAEVPFADTAPITVTIAPKQLEITGITATKVYDGTTAMSITGGTLVGVADGDTVTHVVPSTGTADGADVGEHTVTFDAITIDGTDAKYYIAPTDTTVKGTITEKPITIAIVSAEDKEYNGNTTATVTEVTFNGLVQGESFVKGTDYDVTATFDNANAGEEKKVTATVTLKNGNYSLATTTATTTAAITKAAKVPTPAIAPAGGNYNSAQSVTITSTVAGAKIYYTTDGSDPTTDSTLYSSAVSVGKGETTIKAIAASNNYAAASDIAEATYNIVIPTPVPGSVYNPPAPPAVGTPAPETPSETPTQPTEEPGATEVPAAPEPTLLPVPEPTLNPDVCIYYEKTNDAITVDDKGVELPGVKIVEQNYFKIRDIAYILNGSGSQFEIVYDNATRTIIITTGQAYTPNGTETKDGISNAKGVTTSQRLVVDGNPVEFHAYNIGGSNYVRIRDIAVILGLDVQYDDATGTVKIITAK